MVNAWLCRKARIVLFLAGPRYFNYLNCKRVNFKVFKLTHVRTSCIHTTKKNQDFETFLAFLSKKIKTARQLVKKMRLRDTILLQIDSWNLINVLQDPWFFWQVTFATSYCIIIPRLVAEIISSDWKYGPIKPVHTILFILTGKLPVPLISTNLIFLGINFFKSVVSIVHGKFSSLQACTELIVIEWGYAKYCDLSVVSRSTSCWSQSLKQIIDLQHTDKSWFLATPEFNSCFIIRSPSLFSYFNHFLAAKHV